MFFFCKEFLFQIWEGMDIILVVYLGNQLDVQRFCWMDVDLILEKGFLKCFFYYFGFIKGQWVCFDFWGGEFC